MKISKISNSKDNISRKVEI